MVRAWSDEEEAKQFLVRSVTTLVRVHLLVETVLISVITATKSWGVKAVIKDSEFGQKSNTAVLEAHFTEINIPKPALRKQASLKPVLNPTVKSAFTPVFPKTAIRDAVFCLHDKKRD